MPNNQNLPTAAGQDGACQPQAAGEPTTQPANQQPCQPQYHANCQPAYQPHYQATCQQPYQLPPQTATLPFMEDGELPLPRNTRIVIGVVLAVIALVIAIPIAAWASSADTYSAAISTLDAKKDNVLGLTGTTAAASTAITLLPGDIGTPIADQVANLSSDLLFVLAILYMEKFLLTTLGLISCRVLIPIGLLLLIVPFAAINRPKLSAISAKMGIKFVVFGIAMALLVPASVLVCDIVDNTFQDNIESANAAALEASNQLQDTVNIAAEEEEADDGNFFSNALGAVQNGIQSMTQGVSGMVDDLHSALGTLIDSIAIMVVTSCLIPIVVLLLFLWGVKVLTGIDIRLPMRGARGMHAAGKLTR